MAVLVEPMTKTTNPKGDEIVVVLERAVRAIYNTDDDCRLHRRIKGSGRCFGGRQVIFPPSNPPGTAQ